eukprot:Clim_evm61s136 gene=Clim_evmTU61s136
MLSRIRSMRSLGATTRCVMNASAFRQSIGLRTVAVQSRRKAFLLESCQCHGSRIGVLSQVRHYSADNPNDDMSPSEKARWFLQMGNTAMEEGDPQKAIPHYLNSVNTELSSTALFNLGMAYANTGNLNGAMKCLREVVRLEPESIDARINLGNLLNSSGLPRDALEHYEKAAEQTKDATLEWNMAVTNEKLGELEKAVNHYQQAIKMKPDLPQENLRNCLAKLGKSA